MFAVAEAYPDLKANQNFLALQEELRSTGDLVAYSAAVLQRRGLALQQLDPIGAA
jgi:LemA protein